VSTTSRPARHESVEGQNSETFQIAAVEPHLVGEAFAVQAPALDVDGDQTVAPECRHGFEFLGDRQLEVMAGNTFVECKCLGLVAGAGGRFGEVDEEHARP
jgi:hypothetical protein